MAKKHCPAQDPSSDSDWTGAPLYFVVLGMAVLGFLVVICDGARGAFK